MESRESSRSTTIYVNSSNCATSLLRSLDCQVSPRSGSWTAGAEIEWQSLHEARRPGIPGHRTTISASGGQDSIRRHTCSLSLNLNPEHVCLFGQHTQGSFDR